MAFDQSVEYLSNVIEGKSFEKKKMEVCFQNLKKLSHADASIAYLMTSLRSKLANADAHDLLMFAAAIYTDTCMKCARFDIFFEDDYLNDDDYGQIGRQLWKLGWIKGSIFHASGQIKLNHTSLINDDINHYMFLEVIRMCNNGASIDVRQTACKILAFVLQRYPNESRIYLKDEILDICMNFNGTSKPIKILSEAYAQLLSNDEALIVRQVEKIVSWGNDKKGKFILISSFIQKQKYISSECLEYYRKLVTGWFPLLKESFGSCFDEMLIRYLERRRASIADTSDHAQLMEWSNEFLKPLKELIENCSESELHVVECNFFKNVCRILPKALPAIAEHLLNDNKDYVSALLLMFFARHGSNRIINSDERVEMLYALFSHPLLIVSLGSLSVLIETTFLDRCVKETFMFSYLEIFFERHNYTEHDIIAVYEVFKCVDISEGFIKRLVDFVYGNKACTLFALMLFLHHGIAVVHHERISIFCSNALTSIHIKERQKAFELAKKHKIPVKSDGLLDIQTTSTRFYLADGLSNMLLLIPQNDLCLRVCDRWKDQLTKLSLNIIAEDAIEENPIFPSAVLLTKLSKKHLSEYQTDIINLCKNSINVASNLYIKYFQSGVNEDNDDDETEEDQVETRFYARQRILWHIIKYCGQLWLHILSNSQVDKLKDLRKSCLEVMYTIRHWGVIKAYTSLHLHIIQTLSPEYDFSKDTLEKILEQKEFRLNRLDGKHEGIVTTLLDCIRLSQSVSFTKVVERLGRIIQNEQRLDETLLLNSIGILQYLFSNKTCSNNISTNAIVGILDTCLLNMSLLNSASVRSSSINLATVIIKLMLQISDGSHCQFTLMELFHQYDGLEHLFQKHITNTCNDLIFILLLMISQTKRTSEMSVMYEKVFPYLSHHNWMIRVMASKALNVLTPKTLAVKNCNEIFKRILNDYEIMTLNEIHGKVSLLNLLSERTNKC